MPRPAWFLAVPLLACAPGAPPDFPADYATSYTEVRPCTPSGDHELNHVRILADPLAKPVYEKRRDTNVKDPYPVASVLLKEEHASPACDDLVQWTVMKKAPAGTADADLGWTWQTVRPDRTVVDEPIRSCVGCHAACPDTHEGSCALPPGN